jgi:hypothetical protein
MCLRSSLETMRAQDSDCPTVQSHRACQRSFCEVEYICGLNSNLRLYANEFSKAIFRKENLQSNSGWGLSTFYSLCIIRSLVRKGLIVIMGSLFP